MITIDGSQSEEGGQVLRTSLAFSNGYTSELLINFFIRLLKYGQCRIVNSTWKVTQL